MKARSSVVLGGLALALAASCGGGSKDNGVNGGAFAGTLNVLAPAAADPASTTCANAGAIPDIIWTAGATSTHTVNVQGGDCVRFVNNDAANHQPASFGATACPQLDGPVLAQGANFTTPPFNTVRVCQWQDSLNPPDPGGTGGH